jgi:hypothetical protein
MIAEGEENLQTVLLKFDQIAESPNMEISLSITKSLTIAKHNIKCEIKSRDTMIEQVPNFNYLRVEISAKRDLKQGVRIQTMKATRISGCLNNLIRRNKHMSTEYKVRIYKTNVRPVLTYASETRAENSLYPATSLRTAETKIIRTIHGGKRLETKSAVTKFK